MKKLALLLALCLFVQCIGLTVALSDDVPADIPAVEGAAEGIDVPNEEPTEGAPEAPKAPENPTEPAGEAETDPVTEAAVDPEEEAEPAAEPAAEQEPVQNEPEFKAYLAELKANVALYRNEDFSDKIDELAADAVVIVLEKGENAAKIQYSEAGETKTAYVKIADLGTDKGLVEGNVTLVDVKLVAVEAEAARIAEEQAAAQKAAEEEAARKAEEEAAAQKAAEEEAAAQKAAEEEAAAQKAAEEAAALQAAAEEAAPAVVEEAAPAVEEAAPAAVEEAAPAAVEEAAPVVEEAAPAAVEEAAPVYVDNPTAEVSSIGDAASTMALPEGVTTENAADVLGAGEYDFLAEDVLSVGPAGTDFAVNAAGRLIQYSGTATVVQIPSTVMRAGVPTLVTGIENSAFAGNKTVTQIIVPTSVNWIETGSFKDCTALQSINIPDNVTEIAREAFYGCTSLKSVSWSDSVTNIGDYAFYNCPNLSTLGSPSNVLSIGDYAFYHDTSLTAITWSNQLLMIGNYAYQGCTGLTGLSFPIALTWVGDHAFEDCTNIQKVEFRSNTNLLSIGTAAFRNCVNMVDIYLPDSVAQIGNSAFENCSAAKVLSLPIGGGLQIIQDFTFKNCSNLVEVRIPNGVQEIHREAFYGCSNLLYVYEVPATCSFIGNYAFYGARADCTYVVANGGAVIGTEAFGTSGTMFGVRGGTAHSYANAYAAMTFYDIRIVRYVERCYNVILNRNGDTSGVLYWATSIATKANKGGDIVHNFIFSTEFINRGLNDSQVVEILYQAMLGRASDPDGKAFWMNLLNTGCSYDLIIAGFCNSIEFRNICNSYSIDPGAIALTQNRDKNMNVTAFVQRCYNLIMNRQADVAGLNYWCGRLLSKVSPGAGIVSDFIVSPEFKGRGLSNDDQVEILYNTMLNRASDASGKAYWLSFMAQGMSADYVVKGFSDSVEFRYLCQNYGINAGPINPHEYRDWNSGVTMFVNRLYAYALNRAADTTGLNYECGIIVTKTTSCAEVARGIFTSLECQMQGFTNEQYVEAVFQAMLNRAPTPMEKASRVAQLAAGTTREAFVVSIGNSAEFAAIVKSFGL